ncbi:Microtubule-associated protein 70-5 [Hibiscus syriacus]|uniref:Microtubule-associated protein 70-5 n=1 Tax=Hibiscus syriacus TaxID=106335 RepID=A0A6A3AWG2_HIBSY|nr:Microtubule-associated protein 70-5 [Hibiscus syriacus]
MVCAEESFAPVGHVVLELTRLQNQLKEKERKLGSAQAEIKSLRATEALKDKAIQELQSEVQKLDEKHRVTENVLEFKNLEIKRLSIEKKDALAAQFAAEATLRRVHANQKDDDGVSIKSVIAPLESEIKMYRHEIAALQEDKRALERLTKSKESALLKAEGILRSALERALIVEEEENKILEKTNRQKVLEVEKLSQTIKKLEEAILAGGAAANSTRDYQRQISELNEEKRRLERELARAKVSANRVAAVVANEWKDENDKVMPVKQWLDDRRLLQAEMQRLKDKLAVAERTAKAEAQLKEKFKLRLKILEDGLKHVSSLSPKPVKSSNILTLLTSSSGLRKRSNSQPRGSTVSGSSHQWPSIETETANARTRQGGSLKYRAAPEENMVRKNLWASRCKVADGSEKENEETKVNADANVRKDSDNVDSGAEDTVSGYLYDRLQKEVINLRKFCEAKDSSLNAKDEEIKILVKKVEALSRAMEVESKRVKKAAVIKEKKNGSAKMEDTRKMRNIKNYPRRVRQTS